MEPTQLLSDIKTMMEYQVYIDPLLVYTYSGPELDEVRAAASDMSETLYGRYVRPEPFNELGDFPFSTQIMRWGIYETLMSTAMALSHAETGRVIPNYLTLMQANAKVAAYITHVGIARMYWTYYCIMGHDIMHPMYFTKQVPEADFLAARRHHPYTPTHMDLCLILGIARRMFRIRSAGGERVVSLTRHGSQSFEWVHAILRQSGYIDRRVTMSYVYQFDSVEDWDEMCDVVWPNLNLNRRRFIEWSQVSESSHVLEIGCGTGALTFDAELYRAVGEHGVLTAIDISSGMLDKALAKWNTLGKPPQVVLKLASVERLPFADEAFDVACGCFFLHFVDPLLALGEMKRVVRQDGIVSVYQPLNHEMDKPFFREWFEPLFQLARRRNSERPDNYLPSVSEVENWFRTLGLEQVESQVATSPWVFDDPEIVVQHIVRGVSFFESELAELPWDDRKTMIAELVDRGRDVRRKYPLSERRIDQPGVMIRGIKRNR